MDFPDDVYSPSLERTSSRKRVKLCRWKMRYLTMNLTRMASPNFFNTVCLHGRLVVTLAEDTLCQSDSIHVWPTITGV